MTLKGWAAGDSPGGPHPHHMLTLTSLVDVCKIKPLSSSMPSYLKAGTDPLLLEKSA